MIILFVVRPDSLIFQVMLGLFVTEELELVAYLESSNLVTTERVSDEVWSRMK